MNRAPFGVTWRAAKRQTAECRARPPRDDTPPLTRCETLQSACSFKRGPEYAARDGDRHATTASTHFLGLVCRSDALFLHDPVKINTTHRSAGAATWAQGGKSLNWRAVNVENTPYLPGTLLNGDPYPANVSHPRHVRSKCARTLQRPRLQHCQRETAPSLCKAASSRPRAARGNAQSAVLRFDVLAPPCGKPDVTCTTQLDNALRTMGMDLKVSISSQVLKWCAVYALYYGKMCVFPSQDDQVAALKRIAGNKVHTWHVLLLFTTFSCLNHPIPLRPCADDGQYRSAGRFHHKSQA